jgi:heme-degrading monooxygenase HmoA
MYGTVSRYRLKPGSEQAAIAMSKELQGNPPPGYIAAYTYRLDSGNDEYITASIWSDRDTYVKNSNDERQQRWFQRVRELLIDDPQWSDGEVVHAFPEPSRVG